MGTDAALDYLAEVGFDPVYGARPLKRVIQRQLETSVAQGILRGDYNDGDTVLVDVEDDQLKISIAVDAEVEDEESDSPVAEVESEETDSPVAEVESDSESLAMRKKSTPMRVEKAKRNHRPSTVKKSRAKSQRKRRRRKFLRTLSSRYETVTWGSGEFIS